MMYSFWIRWQMQACSMLTLSRTMERHLRVTRRKAWSGFDYVGLNPWKM